MKCVKYITGAVRRLPNEEAAKLVKQGVVTFSSKGAWKAQGRP